MNALARAFLNIFDPPLDEPTPDESWQLTVATPLLERLNSFGPGWHSEDEVCGGDVGMSIIGARCFWAKQLGLMEYRRRTFRQGYWLRLTPKGARFLRKGSA